MDFESIGKTLQQQYPSYSKYSAASIGEAYAKKMYPSEYKSYQDQQSANIQAGKELAVTQAKRDTDPKTLAFKGIAADVQAGKTLTDVMKKYSSDQSVTPNDILRLYNTGSRYGAAKESLTTLEKLFGVKLSASQQKQAQDQLNKQEAGQNALNALNDIEASWNRASETEKRLPGFIADTFSGLAPNRTAIKSTFFTNLEGELRKSAIGGRITQQEIKWIRDSILPTEFDTNESYQNKLNAVRSAIQRKYSDPNYRIGQPQKSQANSTQGSSSRFKIEKVE